ncbi:MAG: hypothetical protein WCI73_16005 [Phycisphaerae bacterium]
MIEVARLEEVARAAGADLLGIAPLERFAEIDAQHHPRSIFPETQSVIVVGKRITRGCLRGVEEGTQFSLYATYANNWVPHRFLAYATVSIASFLEDNRHEAVPIPHLPPETPPMGIAVRQGAPLPNVMIDFVDAAVRAGLGHVAVTGELMTPEFGPLQRIQVILTDAVLPASPLCATSVCDQCGKCAHACPLGAIDMGQLADRTICGVRSKMAALDRGACGRCRNGAQPNPCHSSGQPDRVAALCMRTCVNRLWNEDRLKTRFANRFRTRPAWQIGRSGVAELQEGEQ